MTTNGNRVQWIEDRHFNKRMKEKYFIIAEK